MLKILAPKQTEQEFHGIKPNHKFEKSEDYRSAPFLNRLLNKAFSNINNNYEHQSELSLNSRLMSIKFNSLKYLDFFIKFNIFIKAVNPHLKRKTLSPLFNPDMMTILMIIPEIPFNLN